MKWLSPMPGTCPSRQGQGQQERRSHLDEVGLLELPVLLSPIFPSGATFRMPDFEEILDDETIASRAIAVSYVTGFETDHAAWQEHDRDAVVVGNVARQLTGLAGLVNTHSARPSRSRQDQHRYDSQCQTNPPHMAMAKQRSTMSMIPDP